MWIGWRNLLISATAKLLLGNKRVDHIGHWQLKTYKKNTLGKYISNRQYLGEVVRRVSCWRLPPAAKARARQEAVLGDFGSTLTAMLVLVVDVAGSDSSAPGSTSSKGVALESFASDLLLLSSCFSSSSMEN